MFSNGHLRTTDWQRCGRKESVSLYTHVCTYPPPHLSASSEEGVRVTPEFAQGPMYRT